jgi:hypothetical protein
VLFAYATRRAVMLILLLSPFYRAALQGEVDRGRGQPRQVGEEPRVRRRICYWRRAAVGGWQGGSGGCKQEERESERERESSVCVCVIGVCW